MSHANLKYERRRCEKGRQGTGLEAEWTIPRESPTDHKDNMGRLNASWSWLQNSSTRVLSWFVSLLGSGFWGGELFGKFSKIQYPRKKRPAMYVWSVPRLWRVVLGPARSRFHGRSSWVVQHWKIDESSNCAKGSSRSNNRFYVYHTRFDRCRNGVRGFFAPFDMRNSTFNISEEVAILFRSLELLFVAVFRFFG